MLDPTEPVVLTELAIWDGEAFIDADAIAFHEGKITAVGDSGDLTEGAQRLSLPGTTIIPGLIDAHVHMVLNPDDKSPPAAKDVPDTGAMETRAARMVESGITTARDLGGGAWYELALRDSINAGEIPGPRLLCAGQPVTSPHGHCHFWRGEAADADEAVAVAQRQIERGVDWIKVMVTGGRITKGSDPLLAQFDLATLCRIVATAHSASLPVAAHCHGTAGISLAAEAGVDTIEHCSWVGEAGWAADYQSAVADTIVKNDIWISPTVNAGWQRMLDGTGTTLERIRKALQMMRAKNTLFMASTDAGIPGVYHHHLPQALDVYRKITQTSAEHTLATATSAAARGLGISQQTGRLLPGLAADLLVLDGNPLTDISALTRPVAVWASGREILAPT
jgi:imidazolonepropionase-like amidohydrolase